MVAGKASRVAYKPVTPDPENNKALLLPFPAQMHITVAEGSWQWLLCRTKPPGLSRKSNHLWPSTTQVHSPALCDALSRVNPLSKQSCNRARRPVCHLQHMGYLVSTAQRSEKQQKMTHM